MESSFVALLNHKLLKDQEEKLNHERSGCISPSKLAQCYHRQYLYIKGFQESDPVDLPTLKRFLRGNIIHKYIQNLVVEKETEVKGVLKDATLLGYADVVEKDYILDIKTMEDWVFAWLRKDGFDVYKEKEAEWIQVACYGILLGKPKIKLLFVNNADVNQMEEYEDYTANWTEKVLDYVTTLQSYVGNNFEPPCAPRLYVKDGKSLECNYCSFRSLCHARRGLKWEEPPKKGKAKK
jgi:hypothetical protein